MSFFSGMQMRRPITALKKSADSSSPSNGQNVTAKRSAVVVPQSLERPKFIATELSSFYADVPRHRCYAVTAKLFGHNDWNDLETAIRRGLPSAPFDEECSDEEYVRRRRDQADLLCYDLGGVDPQKEYPPPQCLPGSRIPPDPQLRRQMAFKRWHQHFSQVAVSEIEPTSAQYTALTHDQFLAIEPADLVCGLPKLIAAWWRKNIPTKKNVADSIESIRINAERPTSLLLFGAAWGELGLYHADVVPLGVSIAGCYYLAERFADIQLQRRERFEEYINSFGSVSENIRREWPKEIRRLYDTLIHQFLSTLSRDDYAYVFKWQPHGIRAMASSGLKTLRKVGAKRK